MILYLTKVDSTNMVTAELIRFCNFCAWPSWSALLGLLKNHFFCVILYLTKAVCTDRVTAELICFCDFCAWLRWSALIRITEKSLCFRDFVLDQVGLHWYVYCIINSILWILCLTKVVCTVTITAKSLFLWILCLTRVVCTDRVTK